MKKKEALSCRAALFALCPLLFCAAGSAAFPEPAETTMPEQTEINLDNLELRYLEWRVEYGEDLPANVNRHPWRNLSASVTNGRLNIHLGEGAPSLTWYGAPGREELDELKALADRLLRERGREWPGDMERRAFDELKQRDKKRLCVWKLVALYNEPGARDIAREFRFQGADAGDNPERPAFETPFAAHVEALVRRLHANAPKTPRSLLYFCPDGMTYTLDVEDDGRTRISRRIRGRDAEESEVDPAVVAQVAAIARQHGIDARHGFAAAGWERKRPDAFELTLNYDTGQEVWLRGLRGVDGASLPTGFDAFARELLAALDAALDGPPDAQPATDAVRQGLKRLDYSRSGMSYESHISYHINTRREAGRDVFRLLRRQANRVADCALSDADLSALEALLTRLNLAAWNGFHGNDRRALDGEGFGLSLEYTDGRKVAASGSNSFPKGYREAKKELSAFLDAILMKSGAATKERTQ